MKKRDVCVDLSSVPSVFALSSSSSARERERERERMNVNVWWSLGPRPQRVEGRGERK